MVAADDGKAIVAGNERVLRARLADGRFFFDQDRKTKLEDWAKKLEGITFHAKIGTVAQKVERIEKLAIAIAESITPPLPNPLPQGERGSRNTSPLMGEVARRAGEGELIINTKRAAQLCKADLVTGMVGEFPELQGVMGRYYAMAQGETQEVADAIRDHYLPLGPDSPVPTDKVAICVALADKLDTLVSMFAAGEKPTGSKDPFALRRAALGVIRIVLENKLRLNLHILGTHWLMVLLEIKEETLNKKGEKIRELREKLNGNLPKIKLEEYISGKELQEFNELPTFLLDRLRVQLKDQGIRHDIIAAALEGTNDDDLVRLVARVKALETFLATPEGTNLLAGAKRAQNIIAAEAKKDKSSSRASSAGSREADTSGDPAVKPRDDVVNVGLLKEPQERLLYEQLETAKPLLGKAIADEDFSRAMGAVAQLRPAIDAFFDKVLVNDPDPAIRSNRLRLLTGIGAVLSRIADFSRIEG